MQYIKERRKSAGYTQEEFAKKLGMGVRRWVDFENEKTDLRFNEMIAVCRALNLRVTISDERSTFDCK